jgi:hypothetical protein
MSQTSDGFELRDSLIALPKRFLLLVAGIPVLSAGLGIYLIVSAEPDSVRAAAILLITLSAPALTVVVGLAASRRVRTDDIDQLVTTWLMTTVQEKLFAYLVSTNDSPASRLHPPLFRDLHASSDIATSSYCLFELTDFDGEQYLLYVKSNIFNVEIGVFLAITVGGSQLPSNRIFISDLEDWEKCLDDPRLNCCADTIHGALCEGYQLYISGGENCDGPYVAYRLRQKLGTAFITSPYTRRYFAEDIAIMAYWLYSEMRNADEVALAPSRGPLG